MSSNNIKNARADLIRYKNESVEVTLQRPEHITSKEKHAPVTVNGKVFYVAYGRKQKVPRYVAEFIENITSAQEKAEDIRRELRKKDKDGLYPEGDEG